MKLRKRLFAVTLFSLFLAIGMSACKLKIDSPESTTASTTSTTTSASCPDLGDTFFTSLLDCQNATTAYCSSSWQTFSNGSTAQCYTPATGYEACGVTIFPTWNYTAYQLQGVVAGGYHITRSLLGCSSDICMCTDPVELEPPTVFTNAQYVASSCAPNSSCTCSVTDCPWGPAEIIVPNTPW